MNQSGQMTFAHVLNNNELGITFAVALRSNGRKTDRKIHSIFLYNIAYVNQLNETMNSFAACVQWIQVSYSEKAEGTYRGTVVSKHVSLTDLLVSFVRLAIMPLLW